MSRLFITPREIDLINDLAKEMIKDVIGQKIYYYSVNEIKTKVDDLYEEAVDKVLNDPIELDALVNWQPADVRTNRFGHERVTKLEAFVHFRDLLDKGIDLFEGDFFTYGSQLFEITSAIVESQIYGEIEHAMGIKLGGKEARRSQLHVKIFGPTSEKFTDDDAVQETFVQQRGFAKNSQGETGDVRALQEKGVLEKPISQPAEVSHKGSNSSDNEGTSTFYDDDC